MAEGRLLKKTASRDRQLAQLTDRSALLYVLSIPHLDVEGRILGLPAHVRGTVVPEIAYRRPDDWTDQLVAIYMLEWTATTDDMGRLDPLVFWYATSGTSVCFFTGFDRNQKLRRDREAPSRLPAPPLELLAQPDMASTGMALTGYSGSPPGKNSELELQGFVLPTALDVGPARTREATGRALQVAQDLEEQITERTDELGFAKRPVSDHPLPIHDLEALSVHLRGSDERTPITLERYRHKGCGEREFARAAESLKNRRTKKPALDSEVRYFVSELARLLRARAEAAA